MDEFDVKINLTEDFSLQKTVECGQAFRWRRSGKGYWCVIEGRGVLIEQEGKELKARFYPPFSGGKKMLKELFRLGDDFNLIMREISRDRHIAEMVSLHRGLRLMRQDPWECLVSYLCSINSNIPRISNDVEKICLRYGERVDYDGVSFYTFPDPGRLSKAGIDGLRRLGLGFRARYIDAAARAVRDGFQICELRKMSYEHAMEELMQLDGVGPKVADCVLLFSLDKLNAFPVDRWVKRGMEKLYFNGEKRSEKALREWAAEYFGEFAGYAQQYLFHQSRTVMNQSASGASDKLSQL
jgi:N-glycosylase/DNA lyase